MSEGKVTPLEALIAMRDTEISRGWEPGHLVICDACRKKLLRQCADVFPSLVHHPRVDVASMEVLGFTLEVGDMATCALHCYLEDVSA